MRTFICTLVIVAFVSPALAADEFYVVQDTGSKKCMVVDKPPANAQVRQIGEEKPYPTRAAAESAMRAEKVCELSR
jgi:hypothetical protein